MLIAVDHGNKQIKTVHTPPFTSGLIQSDTPGFGTDALAYRGKYYTLTDQRIPYRRDKTEDERFFILTLFAIAHEIEAMGQYSGSLMRVQLAVGQLCHTGTGFVTLFGFFAACQKIADNSSSLFPNRAAPGCKFGFVVVQILLVFRSHMLWLYNRIAKRFSVTCMHCNSGSTVTVFWVRRRFTFSPIRSKGTEYLFMPSETR